MLFHFVIFGRCLYFSLQLVLFDWWTISVTTCFIWLMDYFSYHLFYLIDGLFQLQLVLFDCWTITVTTCFIWLLDYYSYNLFYLIVGLLQLQLVLFDWWTISVTTCFIWLMVYFSYHLFYLIDVCISVTTCFIWLIDYFSYNLFYQWLDRSAAYFLKLAQAPEGNCAFYRTWDNPRQGLFFGPCFERVAAQILCEHKSTDSKVVTPQRHTESVITQLHAETHFNMKAFVECNNTGRHWTHNFLACDTLSHCFSSGLLTCDYTPRPPVPMMLCSNGEQRVPYTLVCDHVTHCADGSDEDCVYPLCTTQQFQCDNGQVSVYYVCSVYNVCSVYYVCSVYSVLVRMNY